MKWRVWITSYPGSYCDVDAANYTEAWTRGAKIQQGSHTGEIVEINARELTENFIPPSGMHDELCSFLCRNAQGCTIEHACSVCDAKRHRPVFSRLVRIDRNGAIQL